MSNSLVVYNPNKTYPYGLGTLGNLISIPIPFNFWFSSNNSLLYSIPIICIQPRLNDSPYQSEFESDISDLDHESNENYESDPCDYDSEPYEYNEPIIPIDFQFASMEDLIFVGTSSIE